MEIDSRKNKKSIRKNLTYYLCDEAGHVVKDCSLKKQLKKDSPSSNKKVVTKYYQQDRIDPQDFEFEIRVDTNSNKLLNIYEDKSSKLLC